MRAWRSISARTHTVVSVTTWATFLVVAFVIGGVATAVVLRLAANRRGRRLADLIEGHPASWAALCRVLKDGAFLDGGRPRRGLGPRGTLVTSPTTCELRPDAYEARHGDQVLQWPIELVTCVQHRRRRDLTGIAVMELRLRLPPGPVTLGIFHEAGPRPRFLGSEGRL
jgi:hypothetical protein